MRGAGCDISRAGSHPSGLRGLVDPRSIRRSSMPVLVNSSIAIASRRRHGEEEGRPLAGCRPGDLLKRYRTATPPRIAGEKRTHSARVPERGSFRSRGEERPDPAGRHRPPRRQNRAGGRDRRLRLRLAGRHDRARRLRHALDRCREGREELRRDSHDHLPGLDPRELP